MALDKSSSYLTTFNTPFERYRWRRLSFGVSSVPEVFQRKMHELLEGMTGIEVVADDFIIVGCGTTIEETTADHDKVLVKFLESCKEQAVKLTTDKLNLRQTEVPLTQPKYVRLLKCPHPQTKPEYKGCWDSHST